MRPEVSTWAIGCVVIVVVILLFLVFREQYNQPHPVLDHLRAKMVRLDRKYAMVPMRVGNSSYTTDKSSIVLCIRDRITKKIYDENTLMYVYLHEMAHVISKTQGHGKEFRSNFAGLLERASALGVYDPSTPIAKRYCGVDNTHSVEKFTTNFW